MPLVHFTNTSTGEELLAEEREHYWWPGARVYYGNRSGAKEIHQQFRAYDGERLYGMGQRTHGRLDQKGLALDLVQRNAEVSIPVRASSRGYGFLWNNPAIGRVEFADNVTRWIADSGPRGSTTSSPPGAPAEILAPLRRCHRPRAEAARVGERVLAVQAALPHPGGTAGVAREHKRRGLPLSVIVARLLPLDGDGRLPVRPRRVARPAGDDARAGGAGRPADGLDLADGLAAVGELPGAAQTRGC